MQLLLIIRKIVNCEYHVTINLSAHMYTVYPKKYAHGFCFAVLCCGYTLTDFPISIRLTSLALWQSNDCPSASKATLMNMDKYFMWIHYERLHNHNKAKHNKTVCIFLGIYCTSWFLLQSWPMMQTSKSASAAPATPVWTHQSPHSCPSVPLCLTLWLRVQTTSVSASLEHRAAMSTCTNSGYRVVSTTCIHRSSRYMEIQL